VCLEPAKPFAEDISVVALFMKNDGYPDSTINSTVKRLRNLAAESNLREPNTVKALLAEKKVSDGFKSNLCDAYGHFLDCHGLAWTIPRYKREKDLPRVPSTENVERIIARCRWRYAIIFSILRDVGAMPEELHRVKRRDIDLDVGTLNLPGCKFHKPRVRKVKAETLAMLKRFLTDNLSDQPFPAYSKMYDAWRRARNPLSANLGNPQIKTIRLYDLRHYFGSHHYRKTQNILLTKEAMGHSRVETTLVYTKLIDFNEGDFICKAAKDAKEAMMLIEEGFMFVNEMEGLKPFRKPK
jgi:integrase